MLRIKVGPAGFILLAITALGLTASLVLRGNEAAAVSTCDLNFDFDRQSEASAFSDEIDIENMTYSLTYLDSNNVDVTQSTSISNTACLNDADVGPMIEAALKTDAEVLAGDCGGFADWVSGATQSARGIPVDLNAAADFMDVWCDNPQIASMSGSTTQGNAASEYPRVSALGRFVAFLSDATNLVPSDTNAQKDIFVRDMVARTTERVSVASAGAQANDYSLEVAITPDGRYVAFASRATNLVTGDTNGVIDMFVRNRQAGTTTRVSVSSSGAQASGLSANPVISDDGRYVAFTSYATNLVTGDLNGRPDVFVRDLQNSVTTRVTDVTSPATVSIRPAAFSADARYLSFSSSASNLVLGDTNAAADVFVADLTTGQVTRDSTSSAGLQANGASAGGSLSADGRYVVFSSLATNLATSDLNGKEDIFLKDRTTGAVTRLSIGLLGVEATNDSTNPSISSNGRYVAFESVANNLVAGDTYPGQDIFVRDVSQGTTTLASIGQSGAPGTLAKFSPAISPDGGYVVYHSAASDLVVGDTNNARDVFRRFLW